MCSLSIIIYVQVKWIYSLCLCFILLLHVIPFIFIVLYIKQQEFLVIISYNIILYWTSDIHSSEIKRKRIKEWKWLIYGYSVYNCLLKRLFLSGKNKNAVLFKLILLLNFYNIFIGCSIVVSIPACHAGDRGSIPRNRVFSFFCTHSFFVFSLFKRV